MLLCALILFAGTTDLYGQGNSQGNGQGKQIKGPEREKYMGKYKFEKKQPKLPPVDLSADQLAKAKFNFKASALKGIKGKAPKPKNLAGGRVAAVQGTDGLEVALDNPTSLQFGPDGRMYVAQQNGLIKIYTIVRNGPNDYSVTGEEVIDLINRIPNHNDDGSPAPGITWRQVTSLVVTGTAANPVLYVSSSDSRIGGPDGDMNLDTNSGIISRLTRTASGWEKMDLVRGLPRSEENHSTNGMQLEGSRLYVAIGGFTNAGSPSINFAYITEYALAAAFLSIDLAAIDALPIRGSGDNRYKYDLPTLDDPTRAGNPDANDPFGGNDGLNQAKIVSGGPVQVFATGFRNAYDLVITKTPGKERRMYVMDNGGNQGWGGYPANEGGGSVTNNYVPGEPGSTGPGTNDAQVNNLDNLHYVGNLNNYTPGTFYGGHPNPVRANPRGAGLYTHNGTGAWRTSTTGTNPLPADWPPLPAGMANPVEGDYQNPGETDNALLTFVSSTNGLVEYTASNFKNGLRGQLLAASFDGNIYKVSLNETGTDVTNARGARRLNQDLPFASNFGAEPLDITAQGDNDIFPGTIWVVCYLENSIYVFEPEESTNCTGTYSTGIDDDADGYSNADEIDNGTNPCSSASKPLDFDKDLVSNYNDPDDDNDKLADDADFFPLDAANGLNTTLPIGYELFNNHPGTGLFGLGFTGLMLPKQPGINYQDLYEDQNLIAGGAIGAFSVVNASEGDPYGTVNNQENAFQFGLNVTSGTGSFTVQTRLLGPFFNNKTPQFYQSEGVYIGTGDQDNYLKIVLGADGQGGGLEVLYENNGVPDSYIYSLPGGLPSGTLDLYLSVNPATGVVQPRYAKNGGQPVDIGAPIKVSGALLTAIQSTPALAVGIISTSIGSAPFTATWDFVRVYRSDDTPQALAVAGTLAGTYKITARHSGKSLDVPAASYDNGAGIVQWAYGGGPNQQWRIEPLEGGYYKITAVHSGKALDVRDYSLADGGIIQQYDWNDTDNQKWSIVDAGEGYYKIISKNSGKALDVAAASYNDGAGIVQWAYGGGANQQWKLEQLSASSREITDLARESTATDQVLLQPNPASKQVQVVHYADAAGEASILVRDATSQLQATKRYRVHAGKNILTLSVSSWRSGLYFLELNTEGHRVTKKLVVTH